MSDTLKPLLNEIDNIISNDKERTLVKSTIIKFFNHNEKDYVKIPFKEFYDKLTNKEIQALNSIIKNIQNEGDVSLSVLIAETGISRPVYISLLNKIKEYNMGEVLSRGVKGTHIKFTNPNLICGNFIKEKVWQPL